MNPQSGKQFILRFFKHHAPSYLVGLILMIASTRIRLLYPEYVGDATDYLVSEGAQIQGLWPFLVRLLIVALIAFLGSYVWRYFIIGNARKMQRELRAQVFQSFQELSETFYAHHKTGDLIAHAINDVNAVRMAFGPALVMSINGAAMVGVSILGMGQRLGPGITAKILLPIPLVVALMLWLGRVIRERFAQVQEGFGLVSDRVHESIHGIRVIKAYAKEEQEEARFQKLSKDMARRNQRMVRVSGILSPLVQAGFAVSFGLFFLIAVPLAVRREITLGDFTASANYLGMMLMPVTFIGRIINVLSRGRASLERLDVVLCAPREVLDGSGAAQSIPWGAVRANELTFTYPYASKPALKGVSFDLPAGTHAAVLGESGAGKSTLLHLFLKSHALPEGMLFFDGQDINDFSLATLRSCMGYVPQDTFLFHVTIEENIRFFEESYDEAAVIQAAKDARIHEFIASLPKGYQTVLGERGVNLSGGQKQRIAIARALLRDPAILLLDDALSAVDSLTEEEILHRLKQVRRNKTTFLATHRLSSAQHFDVIFVLAEGTIQERGDHGALLLKGGRYHEFYQSQVQDRLGSDEERSSEGNF
ncbi:Lipid A export ATP-binding/permease protein MsbA [Clostridiaceae bacterium JG1575]|nr:Lipid A export ATP-binding/permease protein MsbA [Clostridiaceae bacterium JG1575]